ncbi:hypothetical protein AB0L70_31570 [Kribbella sp. NPDC051952]|uniref:hypothetical protein n=1 Tax=Kribbella sp. NPDC051952 TaxID=3154851 RepID=UPI00343912BF
MPTLLSDVEERHATLLDLLRTAARRESPAPPGEARMNTDRFLAQASRHAAATTRILLPTFAQHVPAGRKEVRDHLRAIRRLEHTLVKAKAKEYGQAQTVHVPWASVWSGVHNHLTRTIATERRLAAMLGEHLDSGDEARLRDRFTRAIATAPTRPHPHLPHTGVPGQVARLVCAKLDALWDEVEGRITMPYGESTNTLLP